MRTHVCRPEDSVDDADGSAYVPGPFARDRCIGLTTPDMAPSHRAIVGLPRPATLWAGVPDHRHGAGGLVGNAPQTAACSGRFAVRGASGGGCLVAAISSGRIPLEGQASTRIDSDVTHSLVPTAPLRRSDGADRAVRRNAAFQGGGRRGGAALRSLAPRRAIPGSYGATGSATRGEQHGTAVLSDIRQRVRREGRFGDPTERDPAGETRFVRWGEPAMRRGYAARGDQTGMPVCGGWGVRREGRRSRPARRGREGLSSHATARRIGVVGE